MTARGLSKMVMMGLDPSKFEARSECRERHWHGSRFPEVLKPWVACEFDALPPSVPRAVIIVQRETLLADPRGLEELRARVRHLETKIAERSLWRLKNLEGRIDALAQQFGISSDDARTARELLRRLHTLALERGLECLLDPQVDRDEASIELLWLDKRHSRSLSFTVLPSGDPDGRVWMHQMEGTVASSRFDPEEEEIVSALTWIAGC